MTQALRARNVFTPGSFPVHTYINRNDAQLEQQLREGLDTQGMIVSIAGPSKSGKTVLVERVVGPDNLVPITGAVIRRPEDVWDRALDWMRAPSESSSSGGGTLKGSVTGAAKGGLSFAGLATGEVTASGTVEVAGTAARGEVAKRRGMTQVIGDIGDSDFVILIDDFHYVPRDVQAAVAQQIKEAARQKVRIVVASVPHRADDVVRANPDLIGRVRSIDLAFWSSADLEQIARIGFKLLNIDMDDETIVTFAKEAAGSPQLMQAICLNACFELNIDVAGSPFGFQPNAATRARIFERTALGTDYRSLVNRLRKGPRTRGTERNKYAFSNGGSGDVYECILRAIAADPPRLSFSYDKLNARVDRLCRPGDRPVGSSVAGSLSHMADIASAGSAARVIDWDESKGILDIPDPYLIFYLRWSGHLDATT